MAKRTTNNNEFDIDGIGELETVTDTGTDSGNDNGIIGGIERAEFDESESGSRTEKRTRKPRNSTGNTRAAKPTKNTLDTLAQKIKGGHDLAAVFIGRVNPTLAQVIPITDDESQKMAVAVSDVLSHYDLTVNPVVMSWVNLAVCCGIVYVPKLMIYKSIKENEVRN